MVEEDAVDEEHVVGLTVVDQDPVGVLGRDGGEGRCMSLEERVASRYKWLSFGRA